MCIQMHMHMEFKKSLECHIGSDRYTYNTVGIEQKKWNGIDKGKIHILYIYIYTCIERYIWIQKNAGMSSVAIYIDYGLDKNILQWHRQRYKHLYYMKEKKKDGVTSITKKNTNSERENVA